MASTPRQVNPAARHVAESSLKPQELVAQLKQKPVLFYYSYSILCDLRDYRFVGATLKISTFSP